MSDDAVKEVEPENRVENDDPIDQEKVLSDREIAAEIRESLRGRVFSDSAKLLREDREAR